MTTGIDHVGDDERRRVALHESGHAYVAWALGRTVTGVTVVPGRRWGGTTHYGAPSPTRGRDWDRLDPTVSVVLWPAAVRRSIEVRALGAAAGVAAEDVLWWPTRHGPVRTPEPLAERVAYAAPLTGAQRLRLAAWEDTARGLTDDEQLERLGAAMYPEDLPARVAWLRWVAAEARSIVTGGAERIERLAEVLADRGRLSGKAVRAVLESR